MSNARRKEIARNSLLLRGFSDKHLDMLMAMSGFQSFGRGETLFLHGETARSIHVVIDGWVKLFRISPNGGEAVVSIFTRGESFGEAVAFRRTPYPVSAQAVTDCEVMQIPSAAVIEMMRRDPDTAVTVLASCFVHLHSLVAQLEQLKAQTGAQRVAEFLLDLCACEEGGCLVTLPYDKVLIAGRLGMKPESLSRAFSKLKSVGVTISRNSAAIDDIAKLREYSRSDPAISWSKQG